MARPGVTVLEGGHHVVLCHLDLDLDVVDALVQILHDLVLCRLSGSGRNRTLLIQQVAGQGEVDSRHFPDDGIVDESVCW